MGKVLTIVLLLTALVAGAAMYYLQVYAYYEPVQLSSGSAPAMEGQTKIRLTVLETGQPEEILVEDFQGIDAKSSPLRFRACFRTPQSLAMMSETYTPYKDPEPLIGPKWFGCYDAKQIGADLEEGKALAFLGEANITYGIDRVVAVYDDGRAYVWHQLNPCGEKVYNGEPAPEGCPPPPEGSN